MMIIDTYTVLELVPDTSIDQKRNAMYISDFNAVPYQVLEGVIEAFDNARMDHAIGIYSHIFTPIFKKALASRYQMRAERCKMRNNRSSIVSAGVPYVQTFIIDPVYNSIRKYCSDIKIMSVSSNQTISNVHRTYSPEE